VVKSASLRQTTILRWELDFVGQLGFEFCSKQQVVSLLSLTARNDIT